MSRSSKRWDTSCCMQKAPPLVMPGVTAATCHAGELSQIKTYLAVQGAAMLSMSGARLCIDARF